MPFSLPIFITIVNIYNFKYCVSQKEWVLGNQRLYLKMCPPYLRFYFWFNISTNLDSLQENLVNQSNNYEDVAFKVDTNKTWYTQVHKGTSWVSKRKCKSVAPSKSSEFWFLFVSTFKVTSSKLFDWFKRFSYTNCQGKRHIESKIRL